MLCILAAGVTLSAAAQDLKPVKDKATKKYGYQSKSSKSWVIDPVYDNAKRFIDGFAVVEIEGREGLIDTQGDLILNTEYDNIGKFDKNGLCELMIKDGRTKWYGVADQTGRILLPVDSRDVNISKKGLYILANRAVDINGSISKPRQIDRTFFPKCRFASDRQQNPVWPTKAYSKRTLQNVST